MEMARISIKKGKKTLWEKQKLLVKSIFCFSHGVFKKENVLQTRKKQGNSPEIRWDSAAPCHLTNYQRTKF